jgi:catechol 2,3-dioxygenase-like lactoylglutathione lyase family enzyme
MPLSGKMLGGIFMKFDHIAIQVSDISKSVLWYSERFPDSKIEYQDDTWAIIELAGTKLAFVLKVQHPRHIAFTKTSEELHHDFVGKKNVKHRDGTESFHLNDPDGNTIEILTRNTENKDG